MNLGLEGKRALITGGSHGIGLAIARALLLEGCEVAICSRHPEDANLPNWVSRFRCNVLESGEVLSVLQDLSERLPYLDILINNVGGGGRWGVSTPHHSAVEVWEQVYSQNAKAATSFTLWAIPMMLKQQWGRVITIASIHGREAGGRPWFVMAKAAQIALMKSLADVKAYARANITFNTVAPGPIFIQGTGWDAMRITKSDEYVEYREALPLGRLGRPEEVANVVTFLCSDKASLINGACIAVDGGQGRSF